MPRASYETAIAAPAAELLAWHARPGAFERLAPPWGEAHVVARRGTIAPGDEVEFQLRRGPLRLTWVARHEEHPGGLGFADVQVRGPLRRWRHLHEFIAQGERHSRLRDTIEYELPLAPLSHWIAGRGVAARLASLFAFRHARTSRDLARHQEHCARPRLSVGIQGWQAPLARDLGAFLSTGGHLVHALERSGEALLARDPFDLAGTPTTPPPADALVVPAAATRLEERLRQALEDLHRLPRVPSKLLALVEGPSGPPRARKELHAEAEKLGVKLLLLPGPSEKGWQARDEVVAAAHDALMGTA